MATASTLEDELTCSVCFDIYVDPHCLGVCLHTYCLECIHQLQQINQIIQCPECREMVYIHEIKKDFKVQRLLDIYNNGQSVKKKEISDSLCGMCGESKPLRSHCSECEHYMCSNCHKIHRKLKLANNHEPKLVSKIAEQCDATLKALLTDLQDVRKNVIETASNIYVNIENVQSLKGKQMSEIKQYTQEAIADLKENEAKLEKLVENANNSLIQQLTFHLDICEQNKTSIGIKIDSVTEVLKCTDITKLTETTNALNESIKQDIRKMQAVIPEKDHSMDSPVTVNIEPNWDVTSGIQVLLKNLSVLNQYEYELEKKVTLPYGPHKICIINNELWCAGYKSLYIHSMDGNLLKKITHDTIQSALALTHCDNTGHIIVANWNDKGLHQFDSTGKYLSQIVEGSYSDTTYYDQLLYALEYKTGKVFVFNYLNNKWTKVNEFRVMYKNSSDYDRLIVNESEILISSFNNHYLYRHSVDGQFLKQIGQSGKKPGEFTGPLVCETDSSGQSLIVDLGNTRVQIYDCEDRYQVVNIKGMEGWPRHVLEDCNGDLWVTAHIPDVLLKFKRK